MYGVKSPPSVITGQAPNEGEGDGGSAVTVDDGTGDVGPVAAGRALPVVGRTLVNATPPPAIRHSTRAPATTIRPWRARTRPAVPFGMGRNGSIPACRCSSSRIRS